jgi:hypothetical protein
MRAAIAGYDAFAGIRREVDAVLDARRRSGTGTAVRP